MNSVRLQTENVTKGSQLCKKEFSKIVEFFVGKENNALVLS